MPRALLALACARTGLEAGDALLARFARAVDEMDEADRAYKAAVERILPPERAGAMLAAMASFRAEVAALRERTRAAAAYGDFDPLDTFVPSFPGTHADAVRAANLGDRARDEVAQLRGHVNARVGVLLERAEVERLMEAKRARNAAFDRAMRRAVPSELGDRLATQLVQLADGWY